ncbi:acyl-CoA dehydrogenase family protein [Dasania marina]|uniref:acyl-CoA dehydrogenase family protein n=1 Tax=Dasania marina TaxID=471499 RepID=UPI00037E9876|nr:acyl-CoA dehydrogenase family protein [Dasania marina]
MDLSLSEEQTMLSDMVQKLCEEYAPLTVLRELEGTEPGFSLPFWQQIGELGLTGINVDEAYSGLGMGALDGALVAEQFGRALAVSPHHISSVLAADLLANAATPAQKDQWLTAIATGSQFVTVASSEPQSSSQREGIRLRAERKGDALLLTGEKVFVPHAATAAAVVVLARDEQDRIIAVLIPKQLMNSSDETLKLRYQLNHARDPLYKMQFNGYSVPAAQLLNAGECIWSQWQQSMTSALIPLAAYAVGAATRVQEISLDYAKYRKAFGRPIGGFQAIAHYLAEITVAIDGAGTLMHQAAWARDQGRDWQQLAMMAKLQACETFRRAAALCIQIHGGIGYTTEADPQLFFRRAKQLQTLHWDSATLERRIADNLFAESA